MKLRITREDINKLEEGKKRKLNELWSPKLYDVAVARVLKSVAGDEYDEYEFVVGNISTRGTDIYLADLGRTDASEGDPGEAAGEENTLPEVRSDPVFGEQYPAAGSGGAFTGANGEIQEACEDGGDYTEELEEEFSEEDLEQNYERPSTLFKEDCLPLLTIGDMIDLLQRNNFGKHDFYLTASTYDIGCEMGNNDALRDDDGDWEQAELCDVLWESIKELL